MDAATPTLIIPIDGHASPLQRASVPRRVGSKLFAILELRFFPWIFERLPGATWYLPLVECWQLEDRNVYRQVPTPVRVRRTWSGDHWLVLAAPVANPMDMVVTVGNGHVKLDISKGRRRTYSFPLPKACDDSSLEAHMVDGTLTIVARKIRDVVIDVARVGGRRAARVIGVDS